MPSINIYLNFDGNCKEAFEFYKSVFGGEFVTISTFADMPPQDSMTLLEAEDLQKIMHVTLPIGKGTVLMGSDSPGDWGKNLKMGNNFSISINADSKEEANELFDKISKNGIITMDLADTFWGSYFGMMTDQFGVNWMVSHDINS